MTLVAAKWREIVQRVETGQSRVTVFVVQLNHEKQQRSACAAPEGAARPVPRATTYYPLQLDINP